ncbi:MAG: dipeptidase PepE [Dysgonamonadaceae bacterium]|jgi:dipeptidase E|nr:dipeptidase PepE [Dysgonamonadaceae bacterium]
MRLLLISNSTNRGEEYLGWCKEEIKAFLGEKPVNALFIPYAGVTFSFDEYEAKVEKRFAEAGHHVRGVHKAKDALKAVEEAEAIVVGGGNTWQLVRMLHDNRLFAAIRRKVRSGTPYVGWSAGSNIACPTLRTTNDMPIIDPKTFKTLNLIPFQINPHYLDVHPEGHGGETREDRIREFIEINPDVNVLGLREATLLRLEDNHLELKGKRSARLFRKGNEPKELSAGDLSFLL